MPISSWSDITLTADGIGLYRQGSFTTTTIDTTAFTVQKQQVARIWRSIQSNHFFSLAPSSQVNGSDGVRTVLTVTADGRTHSVETLRMRQKALARILATINAAVPSSARMPY
jgi:hypothetical protein